MIEWSKAGRDILAKQKNLAPMERALLEAQVHGAEIAAAALMTPAIDRVSEGLFQDSVREYKENPQDPEKVTNFWRNFVAFSVQSAEGGNIRIPEVPAVDRSREELEALRQEGRMMVYNPGLSYAELGKVFPKMNSYSVREDSPIKDKASKPGWIDVEADIDAPNRNTTQKELEELYKSQGRKGMRESTYIWAGQASKVLTDKYFDQDTTYSRLLESSNDGQVVLAYFYPHGELRVHSYLFPQGRHPFLGGRSEGVKSS